MDQLSQTPLTGNFMAQVTALHSAATTLDSTNAMHFAIKGKLYTHAAFSTTATPTTDVNTGAAFVRVGTNEGSVFVIGLNASGTVQVAQGSVEALDVGGAFINAPQFPSIPDTMCPVAYVVCKAGATAAAKASGWLFGTSNFSGVTGITLAAVDICTLPSRPQVA